MCGASWVAAWMTEGMRAKAGTAALWIGLLGAAWSLPLLGLWQHAEERERMESGIYYTPQRPAAAYLDGLDAQ